MIAMMLAALTVGCISDYGLYRRYRPGRYPLTCILTLLCTFLLIKGSHSPLTVLKGFLFTQPLILIGYCDAKTQEVPYTLLIPVFLSGWIGIKPFYAVIGSLAASTLMLLLSKISGGGIGGGDIVLTAACGFVLGPFGIITGAETGLILFVLVYCIFYRKHKGKHKIYSMAPYLGTTYFLAYLFQI